MISLAPFRQSQRQQGQEGTRHGTGSCDPQMLTLPRSTWAGCIAIVVPSCPGTPHTPAVPPTLCSPYQLPVPVSLDVAPAHSLALPGTAHFLTLYAPAALTTLQFLKGLCSFLPQGLCTCCPLSEGHSPLHPMSPCQLLFTVPVSVLGCLSYGPVLLLCSTVPLSCLVHISPPTRP